MACWASAFTGEPPGAHGVTGNEFFIRGESRFAAPGPVTVSEPAIALSLYTDDYLNDLIGAPTLYEQIRGRDPDALMWVAMHPVYRGADRLILTSRTAVVEAADAFMYSIVDSLDDDDDSKRIYAELDDEIIETVVEEIEEADVVPDLLTVYVIGTDLYAHVSQQGSEKAIDTYLRDVVDPAIGELAEGLRKRGVLEDAAVVVTADHGHTDVVKDEEHSLYLDEEADPPAVLRAAGFQLPTPDIGVIEEDFDATLAYQGAMAFIYLADRTPCEIGEPADWSQPARAVDVLAAADAFHRANQHADFVPAMTGTLDLILVRARDDVEPYRVYVGGGETRSLGPYLVEHPRPDYIWFRERLAELGAGRRADRAGDVLLIANNGNRERAEERYYFSGLYNSWHGSPSPGDSRIPLILSHPERSSEELRRLSTDVLGDRPFQRKLTDLVLALRFGESG